jgi:hypothetical protein
MIADTRWNAKEDPPMGVLFTDYTALITVIPIIPKGTPHPAEQHSSWTSCFPGADGFCVSGPRSGAGNAARIG